MVRAGEAHGHVLAGRDVHQARVPRQRRRARRQFHHAGAVQGQGPVADPQHGAGELVGQRVVLHQAGHAKRESARELAEGPDAAHPVVRLAAPAAAQPVRRQRAAEGRVGARVEQVAVHGPVGELGACRREGRLPVVDHDVVGVFDGELRAEGFAALGGDRDPDLLERLRHPVLDQRHLDVGAAHARPGGHRHGGGGQRPVVGARRGGVVRRAESDRDRHVHVRLIVEGGRHLDVHGAVVLRRGQRRHRGAHGGGAAPAHQAHGARIRGHVLVAVDVPGVVDVGAAVVELVTIHVGPLEAVVRVAGGVEHEMPRAPARLDFQHDALAARQGRRRAQRQVPHPAFSSALRAGFCYALQDRHAVHAIGDAVDLGLLRGERAERRGDRVEHAGPDAVRAPPALDAGVRPRRQGAAPQRLALARGVRSLGQMDVDRGAAAGTGPVEGDAGPLEIHPGGGAAGGGVDVEVAPAIVRPGGPGAVRDHQAQPGRQVRRGGQLQPDAAQGAAEREPVDRVVAAVVEEGGGGERAGPAAAEAVGAVRQARRGQSAGPGVADLKVEHAQAHGLTDRVLPVGEHLVEVLAGLRLEFVGAGQQVHQQGLAVRGAELKAHAAADAIFQAAVPENRGHDLALEPVLLPQQPVQRHGDGAHQELVAAQAAGLDGGRVGMHLRVLRLEVGARVAPAVRNAVVVGVVGADGQGGVQQHAGVLQRRVLGGVGDAVHVGEGVQGALLAVGCGGAVEGAAGEVGAEAGDADRRRAHRLRDAVYLALRAVGVAAGPRLVRGSASRLVVPGAIVEVLVVVGHPVLRSGAHGGAPVVDGHALVVCGVDGVGVGARIDARGAHQRPVALGERVAASEVGGAALIVEPFAHAALGHSVVGAHLGVRGVG